MRSRLFGKELVISEEELLTALETSLMCTCTTPLEDITKLYAFTALNFLKNDFDTTFSEGNIDDGFIISGDEP